MVHLRGLRACRGANVEAAEAGVIGGRHSFGTLAVQVFPLTDVKAYMGHADIATTMIYIHHVPQVDAAEKLSAALRDASAPPLAPSATRSAA